MVKTSIYMYEVHTEQTNLKQDRQYGSFSQRIKMSIRLISTIHAYT